MKTRGHKLGRGVGALAMTLLTAFTCVCSVSAVGAEKSAGSRFSAESKDKEHIIMRKILILTITKNRRDSPVYCQGIGNMPEVCRALQKFI